LDNERKGLRMRDHTKLKVFEIADRLAVLVYQQTAHFPESERYGLQSQLRRAAVSIAANIVEGCARSTQADYSRFLEIAYGSARELQYEVSLTIRLGSIDSESARQLADESTSVAKALNSLLRSMRGVRNR
jgi:four helix bundle protein